MTIARIAVALISLLVSYAFSRYVGRHDLSRGRLDVLLVTAYVLSRLALWLVFAVYLQRYVTTSDPRLFYQPMLNHLLAGEVPVRDFYYTYGPALMPAMLPFYVLLGRSLAGISLFAIVAETVALVFFLKSARVLEQRGDIDHSWVQDAIAVYILNPATLYWTVLQGYHSVVQTTYSMAALYFLLRRRTTLGYAVGLYSVAGTKLLAVLDWPALLVVRPPRLAKLTVAAVPLLATLIVFQFITGDAFAGAREHLNKVSEGNVWYLMTMFGGSRGAQPGYPGSIATAMLSSLFLLLGVAYWLKSLSCGVHAFSFQAALGITTFTMALFFLFSGYTGDYYVPMLMLPASVVVTCPALKRRGVAICSLLLISGLCTVGDAIWTRLGQPMVLVNALSAAAGSERRLALFWTASIVVRVICFAMLAQFGLYVATHDGSTVTASLDDKRVRL